MWYQSENTLKRCYLDAKKWFEQTQQMLRDQRKDSRAGGGKLVDDKFTHENDACWYAGGEIDSAGEALSQKPAAWKRVSDLVPQPLVFPPGSRYTCLHQGFKEDGYFVDALQAVALRGGDHKERSLVRQMIPFFDAQLGLYVVFFHKNGMWVTVYVDDYLPLSASGEWMCTTCPGFPSVCWPAIVEKAYAKLHNSYEAIGGGGLSCEALTDLTGGVGGRFGVRDVAADRLFIYLHELQRESLFVAKVDARECAKRGIRLPVYGLYVIARAAAHEGRCYVQLLCPGMAGGPFDDVIPYSLLHSRFYPEKSTEGFFWVAVEDFQNYFSFVHECRLVQNPDAGNEPQNRNAVWCRRLDDICLDGMAEMRRLAANQRPLYETIFAVQQQVQKDTVPEFDISVAQGQDPCEVYVQVEQRCNRLKYQRRVKQEEILLSVHEHMGHNKYALVAKSNNGSYRDSFVSFKAVKAAEFVVSMDMPLGASCEWLIFRCYASHPLQVKCHDKARRHDRIIPKEALSANAMSFVGRGASSESGIFDESEGLGNPMGRRQQEEEADSGGCSVQ